MKYQKITTLGQLKKSGYKPKSIKQELRDNLVERLKSHKKTFDKIVGFDTTVIPDVERAILSKHNILLLGLRGQAKTRMARQMVNLLDEYIPIVAGSEILDDPFQPLSVFAKNLIEINGDETPIAWVHRDERFGEKLATPDVTVADLIGDVDPIKAATQKLHYADERVLHFGIIPRCNRSIFVINELPDLQARIQVALFNLLEEGDLQIRGFKLRFPLDILFVFTANPEDYTNRGSIVTPLKDRIESQILTHYPKTIEDARQITAQESKLSKEQVENIVVPDLVKDLVEHIAFAARDSEFVDEKSGVSARLTISAMENLVSTAERRALMNNEKQTVVRISDLAGVFPAITGKIEMVYEGEQEGPVRVAQNILDKAIRNLFVQYFPNPSKPKKRKSQQEEVLVFNTVRKYFEDGNVVDLLTDVPEKEYEENLDKVTGLRDLVLSKIQGVKKIELNIWMEFVLHGMAAYSLLSKFQLEQGNKFTDITSAMFNFAREEDVDDDLKELFK
ncbi:MAG: putative magnesium protoporphyrin chelatase [Bacteroidota bacterium]|nr:putative magnesium protoporphyrin chelatase [Bacteroidota bacterium]